MVSSPKVKTKDLIQYAELHAISNFSFLKGASHPEEIVAQAASLNYHAIALTDECSLAGVVKAHMEAKQQNIHLLIGSEFLLEEGLTFLVITPSRLAYAQLSQMITTSRQRAEKGFYKTTLNDLLHKLSECFLIFIPDKALYSDFEKLEEKSHKLQLQLRSLFEKFHTRIWIAKEHHFNAAQDSQHHFLEELSDLLKAPILACGNVKMHKPERQAMLDTINAIRLRKSVAELGLDAASNSENHLQAKYVLKNIHDSEHLQETMRLSERCYFSLDELKYEYPQELVPKNMSPLQYLRQLVEIGINEKWPKGIPEELKVIVEKEINLIHELKYEYYFLTVYEIVHFARSQGILCQGRGSAANSIICFCLGITSVNPEQVNLLFERFISKERNEPPDIDVDFEHERREEVIQHIYKKYGRDRAAITATVVTYQTKSAIREVGKALGFDLSLIEFFSKSLAWWDKSDELISRIEKAGFHINNHMMMHFMQLVVEIRGFPRHLSQHVGGFLISQGPIAQLVPIENASMPERTVIQWDKTDIEALGLLKVDVLALGMLSAIRKSFDLVKQYRDYQYTLANLPQEDARVYKMLQAGDSVGLFQVESRAQMSMLPRLKPKTFYDLVIQVAIVRPGPIQGGMVHPYLKRRDGLEKAEYPSEELRTVLDRTLGVPIFQEQVIQIAMVAAGFSAGEADQLRRAIASADKHSKLYDFKNKIINGMMERNYTRDFAERIWEQIKGFAGFGFPESHSASFALLVYVSAWLKYYEPAIFCCALLNSLPMGFYSASQLIQDVKRHHVKVLAIDILHSNWNHNIEVGAIKNGKPELKIRLGFRLVKGLSKSSGEKIETQRARTKSNQLSSPNLHQIKQLYQLDQAELDLLASAGALQCLTGHKYQSRWEVQAIEEDRPLLNTINLFEHSLNQPFDQLIHKLAPPTPMEDMNADYKSTGLSLNLHPLSLLRKHPEIKSCKNHQQLLAIQHGRFVQVAGMVTGKQRPGSAKGVIFITLEDETGNNNIIVWSDQVKRYKTTILKARLLKIKGHIEREGIVQHIIAGHIEDISHLLGELKISSRDFH